MVKPRATAILMAAAVFLLLGQSAFAWNDVAINLNWQGSQWQSYGSLRMPSVALDTRNPLSTGWQAYGTGSMPSLRISSYGWQNAWQGSQWQNWRSVGYSNIPAVRIMPPAWQNRQWRSSTSPLISGRIWIN